MKVKLNMSDRVGIEEPGYKTCLLPDLGLHLYKFLNVKTYIFIFCKGKIGKKYLLLI